MNRHALLPRPVLAIALLTAGCTVEPTPAATRTPPATCVGKGGCITTVVGTGDAARGDEDVTGWKSELYWAMDAMVGPDGKVYYIDWNNHRIRTWDPKTELTRTVIGANILGDKGSGEIPTSASLNHPTGITFDKQGRLWIAAWHNSKLKRIDPTKNILEDVCGTGARAFGGDGVVGGAKKAKLDLPSSVAFDSQGNVYFSDQANQRIRKVDTADTVTTVVGDHWVTDDDTAKGAPSVDADGHFLGCDTKPIATKDKCTWDAGAADHCAKDADGKAIAYTASPLPAYSLCGKFGGDGGPGLKAFINGSKGQNGFPSVKMVIDKNDVMYIADTGNHRIRRLDLKTGIIDTVAGVGTPGFSGDGGDAKAAELTQPTDVEVMADGALLVADMGNHCLRIVKDGKIATFAGQCGKHGDTGDGGPAKSALLYYPYGVGVGPDGTVYVADTYNHRLRVITK